MKAHQIIFLFISIAAVAVGLNYHFKKDSATSGIDIEHKMNDALVVVMMVKNEEDVICKTLDPYVNAKFNSFFIFDTGSTDKTVEITKKYFADKQVNGIIMQEPFIDFAVSRNRALKLAQQKFPNSIFMLMPDAEWYMQNPEGLLDFCEKHRNDKDSTYGVLIKRDNLSYYNERLIRTHSNARYVGAVHEYIDPIARKQVPETTYFHWKASNKGQNKSNERWKRDLVLLINEQKREPQNARTAFYLAQTYECLGDLENARIWYKKRSIMPGWDEENFMATYRLGDVYERLDDWENALYYYEKAYSMRPHRAEPLVAIAKHYLSVGDMESCFKYAKKACDLPYPKKDILFIDRGAYEYDRQHILGTSAWYVGEYEIGEKALREALKVKPKSKQLLEDLSYYTNRKKN